MNAISLENRIKIIQIHYENGRSVKTTFRKIIDIFGRYNRPSEPAIKNLVEKFESTGSVQNARTSTHTRSGRSTENIADVSDSVADQPNLSIRRRSQQLGISRSTTWRILHKDLALKAYKVELVQELKPADHSQRRNFADFIIEHGAEFAEKIIFSDEAHFHLNGYVNKQNCRIWASENPRVIVEKPLHPTRVTVWCGLWAGGVIGPYFFENDRGEAVTVNGICYRNMITEFLWPIIDDMDTEDMWFQQDDATCHTSNETLELIHEKFPDRLISRFGDVNWPPRSCDLTPLDYFLWGYVKDEVYKNNPTTIEELKTNIEQEIREIQPQLCKKVIENFTQRIDVCKRARGGHLDDIIFKH